MGISSKKRAEMTHDKENALLTTSNQVSRNSDCNTTSQPEKRRFAAGLSLVAV